MSQSIRWVVRSGGRIARLPHQSGFPRENEEPYINSPVPEAIQVARRLQAGADEQAMMTLMGSGGGPLIESPR